MIKTFQLGDHSVEVDIFQKPGGLISFVPMIDGKRGKESIMNCSQIPHDHSEEQMRKDIDEFAARVAAEHAGLAQAALLSAKIFGARE